MLARFNADGSLDTSFDADGKVTTDMVGGTAGRGAGVAIQPDGKIVVAGCTGSRRRQPQPLDFALARYNADGSLDTSFGTGGKVADATSAARRAYAVAIQPDGKIVVAGAGDAARRSATSRSRATTPTAASTRASAATARRHDDRRQRHESRARNIVLQPDGAIVVSGKPVGSVATLDHTDVVRYNCQRQPRSRASASAARSLLSGALVGEGLALQGDGKFVLVGSVDRRHRPES